MGLCHQKTTTMRIASLIVLFVPAVLSALTSPSPKQLYILDTDILPAFCNLIRNDVLSASPSSPVYDLAYSSFSPNPRQIDPVMRIEAVSMKYTDASQMGGTMLTDQLDWPNEVAAVPSGIFSLPQVWAVSSGFFMTGKDDGEVALFSMTDLVGGQSTPVKISNNPSGILWYYHRIEWHDMNGDGFQDIVTERANGGGPSANVTQLLWFENPGSYQLVPDWNAHVLTENKEDVFFRLYEMPYNGGTTTAIISSGFYSNILTVVWSTTNDFTDLSSIQTLIVDDYGWYFDVEIVDINNDGKMDILTSTWSQQGKPGAVLAYEIPDGDWTTQPWTRHILQDGYKSFIIAGSGSPGTAAAYWPQANMKDQYKPYIMVSGDDDGSAYVLTPNSENQDDWSYTQTTIFKGTGTVGAIAVGDVDDDGFAEVFIPAYTMKQIVVMTYRV